MVRQPGSKYVNGRSTTLLKIKRFFDAEARVLRHVPGSGKHSGRIGALEVELPDKTRFSVGTGFSDKERENPPAIGSIITFRYQELSKDGVPRFPSYVGIRHDFAWPGEGAKTVSDEARSAINPVNPKGSDVSAQSKPAPAPSVAKPATKLPPSAAPKPADVPAALQGAAQASVASAQGAGSKRRFEFAEGGSSKFWELEMAGTSFTVTFGRIGSVGKTLLKSFDSDAAATAAAAKLVAEKVGKGYREV